MPPLDFLVLKEVNRGLANFIKINQAFKPYILSQANLEDIGNKQATSMVTMKLTHGYELLHLY